MGIVGIIAFAGAVALLIVLAVKINGLREEEPDENLAWGLKVLTATCLIGVVASGAWVVDAYFVEIETPFDPPAAELPEKPDEVKDPEPPKIKAPEDRDLVKGAKDEHREALDDFAKNAKPDPNPEGDG